ncbi:MAG: hypothetical protein ACI4SJ_03345 [Candidatus Avispirillum sp.]
MENDDRMLLYHLKDGSERQINMGNLFAYIISRIDASAIIDSRSVIFDNENTGLVSVTVQTVLVELLSKINSLESRVTALEEAQNA